MSFAASEHTRLQLALAAGGLGVWEWDRTTGTVIWDHTMERLYGLEPGGAPATYDQYVSLLYPDDREVVVATVQAAVATGEDYTVEHRVTHPDGTVRWLQGRGHPISDGESIVGIIGVTGDITDEREIDEERSRLLAEESAARAEADAERARLEFIIEAKAALSEHIGLDSRLAELARLSIPRFADASAVHLIGESGEPELIALHHRDPSMVGYITSLFDRYPVRLENRLGIGAAIREGQSLWLPDLDASRVAASGVPRQQLEFLRSLDISSGLVVPLTGPDGPFGAVTFITTGQRHMRRSDLVLIEQLCSRVAVLLRNAQLVEARERDRHQMHAQAALLQSVLEASIDGFLAVAPDGSVLAHNQRFLQLWELDEAVTEHGDLALLEVTGERVRDRESYIATVKRIYEEQPERIRDEIELANDRVLDRYGTTLRGVDGEYLGFLWTFRDITVERAQARAVAEAGERSATLARTLQQSLLPPRLPVIHGIDLAARYHPGYEGLDIGGDFYDVFTVGGDWILVIGDVCGKGAEAAAVTALARYSIRASASHDSDPASILEELNHVMLTAGDDDSGVQRFVTVCCIRLRLDDDATTRADVSCGGHQPPLVLRADGRTELVGEPGTLLGVFDEVSLSSTTVELGTGDAVVLVTDGVLEARFEDGREFGIDGVTRVACAQPGALAATLCDELATEALAVQQGMSRDDIAILVARVDR